MPSPANLPLRLWAPLATKVEVEITGKRHVMSSRSRGVFEFSAPDFAHGTDYTFYVDGRGPLPDPRSPWQPAGVFGPSRHVDHARFKWNDQSFRAQPLAAGVLYELHVGTFTPEGHFDAAITKLPHLAQLGVTHVEVMPVHQFSGARGWGYDGVDLFAPHHAYGEPEAMKRFVDAAHAQGLAVILDVVYNHFGPAGNFVDAFAPYFTTRYHTPWGRAVNLDGEDCDEVRRFLCDNALTWLRDYHVDGLRIDAVHELQDHSSMHIIEQLSREVQTLQAQVGRPLVLIAESDFSDPRMVLPVEAHGLGMDAQWNDDWHNALHAVLTGERRSYYRDFGGLTQLAKAIEHVFVYDGGYSEVRRRSHGRPAGDTPRTRFLAYAQNHDQIGNRAAGDRLSATLSAARLRMAAALVLTGPFVPMLFQGEEWAATTPFQYFTDHADEALGRAVREGRRQAFGDGWTDSSGAPTAVPDPQAVATFEESKLNWNEPLGVAGRAMIDWHRRLIALRRLAPRSRTPARVAFDEQARWLLMECSGLAVGINLGPEPVQIPVPPPGPTPWTIAMSVGDPRLAANELILKPEACAVLSTIGTP